MTNHIINGEVTNQISVLDRGFHYGDGVFETLVAKNGRLLHWSEHMVRLEAGCNRLNIQMPDSKLLEAETRRLLDLQQSVSTSRFVIKIIVTRGIGKRGYKPPADAQPTRVVAVYPYPDYPAHYFTNGVKITRCKTPLSCNPALAGIKHLNRLEQILAQDEWQEVDIVDGIMLNNDHHVIECTMSNIFWASNNQVFTPDLSECGVEGVTRAHILQLAKELQLVVTVGNFNMDNVLSADEVLISNSVFGILPVCAIDNYQKPVGPITRQLMESFE